MKKWKQLYCIIFFLICLCPSLGMLLTGQEASSENRELAKFPELKTEEGINREWLSQAGDYFQEHFAFRSELVTANALLNGKILGVSTADGVIQGRNGWLYYKDSLSDYLGTELMSQRSLYNTAHILAMTQSYLESKGVRFLFTAAPNKNSLYGENMPYYYNVKVSSTGNLEQLKPFLEKEQVTYADLYRAFSGKEEVLYHQRDSHWNNKGAAYAAEQLMTALDKEHDSYEEETYTVRRDFQGDLDNMLYPLALTLEDEIYYDKTPTFAYVGEVESNFDPRITTVNPVKSGSLVMYRDSFGNSLLPFLADAYANAYFSRGVPYQLNDVDTAAADTVIIERAERFLPEIPQSPPVMAAEAVQWNGETGEELLDSVRNVQMKRQGLLTQITGSIGQGCLETDSRIYLRLNGTELYEAFPMDIETENGIDDSGFCLYLESQGLASEGNTLEIMFTRGEKLIKIYETVLKEETNK
ncbi:MAG: hypothetical protein Q4D16_25845 [Eubacteriales bacterium]|nr:hypothetical protein [Eubacteriales bacterium]